MQEQEVHTTLPTGSVIRNRYSVETLLGRGGFGAVYRVKDQQGNGNLFALKEVISPDSREDTQQGRNRFTFESEVLMRLDHDALPRVYRVFEDDDHQRAAMLMDYIDGPNLETLRQQQEDKRLSWTKVMNIMAPIFDAISYLHSQQPPIIHRDIKPANIIVPPENAHAMLVDFDIAKEYTPEAKTTAIRRCSRGYGAPEQYSQGTSTRTDIYGLGATLYTLLTGVVPPDALQRITQVGSQEEDGLVPVEALAPSLPLAAAEAIHKALSLKSEDRFASVDEFWQTLDMYATAKEASVEVSAISSMKKDRSAASPVDQQRNASNGSDNISTTPRMSQGGRGRKRRILISLAMVLAFLVVSGSTAGFWFVFSNQRTALSSDATAVHHATPAAMLSPVPAVQRTLTPVSGTATPAASATGEPIRQKTPVQSLPPTAAPTPPVQPTPSPPPLPSPTPVPNSYPALSGSYHGTLVDTTATPNISAAMSLSSIVQNQGAISGFFSVAAPLQGNGPFSGTVGTNKYIQFTVAGYNGSAPLYFWGFIQTNRSLQGQYCSLDQNGHCSASVGAGGYWSVSP